MCTLIGWDQCFIESPDDDDNKDYDKSKLCFVACKGETILFPVDNYDSSLAHGRSMNRVIHESSYLTSYSRAFFNRMHQYR